MSASSFFVSAASVRQLKAIAQKRLPNVSSAHLTEAVAFAIGYNTNAALRTALATRPTVEALKPSNQRLVARLRQFNYNNLPTTELIPELDQSYGPFGRFPLRKKRGVRWQAWRNLLVTGINAGLEQRHFGLSPQEDWWPGAVDGKDCTFDFLFGNEPATAKIRAISGEELSVTVMLNPHHSPRGRTGDTYIELIKNDACARGWLERKLGAWIQDGGEDLSCKRLVQARVAATTVEPKGYSDQGSFFL